MRLVAHTLMIPFLVAAWAMLAPQADASAAVGDDQPREDQPLVVEIVLSGVASEDPPAPDPFNPRRNFRGKLLLLRKIAADPDVDGVLLDLRGVPSWAHTLDLLTELQAIRDAGKTIACYAEVLDQRSLMLGSVADLLVVPPSGMIVLEGLSAELMYMADLLERLDVKVEVLHEGDFKTAFEDYARNSMSPQQRQMLEELLGEFYDQMISTIAGNRGVTRETVEALFRDLMVDPKVAAEAGLIDAAVYHDQFLAKLEQRVGGEPKLVDDYGNGDRPNLEELLGNPFTMLANLEKILDPPPPPAPTEAHVAVVYATGTIMSGKSQVDWQGNVTTMGSDTIVEALRLVGEDENVKAVVLRVNSPGGSALASDMIWRAVQRLREQKPVISSMGSVAASGGYWISMGCDMIMAQPSTVTGSIGVVSMVPDVHQAVSDLGITVEVVAMGPHGDQLSFMKHGLTPVLRNMLHRMMGATYDEFIAKVSDGRNLDPETVRGIAGGRVWTGRQAEGIGLVDAIGGLQDAIDMACVLGGGLDTLTTPVAEYPIPPSILKQFEEQMKNQTLVRDGIRVGLLTLAEELGLGSAARQAQVLLDQPTRLGAHNIQVLMPFAINLR